MPNIQIFTTALLAFSLFSSQNATAQDRLFTYTYQSTVLGSGQREIEVWNTMRMARAQYFGRLDHRIEYEMGLGHNLQTAFYLNAGYETTLEKGMLVGRSTGLFFSNEWKWKLADPVASPVGIALYGEIECATDEFALETKLILDKQIGETFHSFNAVAESEWEVVTEAGQVKTEFNLKSEFDYGFAFRLSRRCHIGFEASQRNEWNPDEGLKYSSLNLGPAFSFSMEKFWANLTVLPQLAGFKSVDGLTEGLELAEHEKLEVRLIFSWAL